MGRIPAALRITKRNNNDEPRSLNRNEDDPELRNTAGIFLSKRERTPPYPFERISYRLGRIEDETRK